MRKAIRTVERIEWEETYTTLEAVVREQELTLEHRPPCNQHSGRPESYVYLKVRDTGPGLRLYVSNRPTKNLAISTQEGETREGRRNHYPILLGPFRGRSRLTRALGLLQRCYPIRLCSRQTDTKPCSRGQVGECLAPCSDDPAALQAHDTLVQDLVGWLAGGCSPLLPDPTKSAGHLARQLTRRGRHEEARQIRKACGDLLNIRRSYAALVEACSLRFAVLWPLSTNGDGAALRLNVVWEGRMREPVSLRPQDLQQTLDATLAGYPMVCGDNEDNTEKPRNPRIIAVRQDELDLLLTTRHWLKEIAGPATVVTLAGPTKMHMTEWRYRLLTEATRMLGEQPLPTG
jgi:excinuclease UvrABC nuclease subunit